MPQQLEKDPAKDGKDQLSVFCNKNTNEEIVRLDLQILRFQLHRLERIAFKRALSKLTIDFPFKLPGCSK